MISFDQFINERINSKRLRYDIIKYIMNDLSLTDDTKILTQIKRGMKRLLSDYVNDKNIRTEVKIKFGNRTRGSAGVSISNMDSSPNTVDLNIEIDKKTRGTDEFYKDLLEMLTHEMTHVVQQIKSNYEMGRSNVRRDIKLGNRELKEKEYLSRRVEIEAYAINAAQELDHQNLDKNKVLKALKDKIVMRDIAIHFSPSILKYYRAFYNSNDRKDQKVWQTFMKKVIQHLQ